MHELGVCVHARMCVCVCVCVRVHVSVHVCMPVWFQRFFPAFIFSTTHQQLRLSTGFPSFFMENKLSARQIWFILFGMWKTMRLQNVFAVLTSSYLHKHPSPLPASRPFCSGCSIGGRLWVCEWPTCLWMPCVCLCWCVSMWVRVCVSICAYMNVCMCVCSVSILKFIISRKPRCPGSFRCWLLIQCTQV